MLPLRPGAGIENVQQYVFDMVPNESRAIQVYSLWLTEAQEETFVN
jgi:squalene cyclase